MNKLNIMENDTSVLAMIKIAKYKKLLEGVKETLKSTDSKSAYYISEGRRQAYEMIIKDLEIL